MDEYDLIGRARHGDERAFVVLLNGHRDRIEGICWRACSRRADVADAVQEACIDLWRGLRGFRGEARFSTWAYPITLRAALRVDQRSKRHPVAETDAEDAVSCQRAIDERVSAHDAVARALARLPPEARRVVILRDFLDMGFDDIAAEMNMAESSVRSLLSRAHKAIKRLIEGDSRD